MNSIEDLVQSDAFKQREFAAVRMLIKENGDLVGYLLEDSAGNRVALSRDLLDRLGLAKEYFLEYISVEQDIVEVSKDEKRYWLRDSELVNVDKDDLISLIREYDVGRQLRVYPKYSSIELDCVETLRNILSNDGEGYA